MKTETLSELIRGFCRNEREDTFYDFKTNYAEPRKIGRDISALSNAATLADQTHGYLIYGVDDKTHEIVGTTFRPKTVKGEGNEDLIPWLTRLLTPRLDFEVRELVLEEKQVVIFEIPAAYLQPVSFEKVKYIRIDTTTGRLDDYPLKERELWKKLEQRRFEADPAADNLTLNEVYEILDVPKVFSLLELPLPETKDAQMERLGQENLIVRIGNRYSITNLGAILFARNLDRLPNLGRKMLRIILYSGSDRLHAKKEWVLPEGYALSLQRAITIIEDQLPSNEIIEGALRKDAKMYPTVAIREFLANAVIHQDFLETGVSPMVELFSKRMEIMNPGKPLVAIDRLIDCAPRSRNERLARLMRRMRMCEERGSGVDRAITAIEDYQLPAPDFEEGNGYFRVTMFAYETLAEMGQQDKVRACYQHSCLCYVKREYMTNTTLRNRLGIEERNYPLASRVLKQTQEKGLIKIQDPEGEGRSARNRKYLPYWG
ncbi:ATP-binding protein [Methanorbis furvi]|uniref:Schlafen AlbA-2 domain-containing protein n=1 Tax=Methanorbis furvi TaxID=3028299 RepID=A0AAE4S8P5_9EURY|nr:hypothetical protein [Methanocorpusculaceae archaeon Ag1]